MGAVMGRYVLKLVACVAACLVIAVTHMVWLPGIARAAPVFCFGGGVFHGDVTDPPGARGYDRLPSGLRLHTDPHMSKSDAPECASASLTVTWQTNWGQTVTGEDVTVGVTSPAQASHDASKCYDAGAAEYCVWYSITLTDGVGGSLALSNDRGVSGAIYVASNLITQHLPTSSEAGGAPNLSQHTTTCSTSQPVNCATGQFWHYFDDIDVPGRGAHLHAGRTYVSGRAGANGRTGFGWIDDYAMSLAVSSYGAATITQENGSTVTFLPDGTGGFTGPSVLGDLRKNADGAFVFTRRPAGTVYLFSAAGLLMSITDRNGYVTALAYTGAQLMSVTDQAGRKLRFTYDASGRIVKETDPANRSVAFTYNAAGDLASVVDVAGRTWTFSYDSAHRMLSMTDPRAGVLRNVYDAQGRVATQTDPLGRRLSFAYTGDPTTAGTTTITSPGGVVTRHDYSNLTLTAITVDNRTTSITYDPRALGIASVTNPLQYQRSYTYDGHGNLLTARDPDGATTTYTYSAQDDPLTVTDPNGVTETTTYDADGNPLTVSRPLTGTSTSRVVSMAYDPARPSDLTAVTDPTGRITRATWTANGDLASSTAPDGGRTSATYDAVGRRTTMVSPAGKTTTLAMNAYGDLTKVTDPLGQATAYGYDAMRSLTSVTDAAGKKTTYTVDKDGERTSETAPDNTKRTYTYTADGNRATGTDPAGHVTRYAYDNAGRLRSVTDPGGGATSYTYDNDDRVVLVTDAAGRLTNRSYDAVGRVTNLHYSDGSPQIQYTYDAAGRRTGTSDATGQTTHTYDSLDRLVATVDGAGQAIRYDYDLAGRVTRLTYPTGKVVTRGYDTGGRLASVADWLGKTTTFRYDVDGNLTGTTYPNGVTSTATYNATDMLTSVKHARGTTNLATFTYTRNPLAQVLTNATTGTTTGNDSYTYSTRDQLTGRSGTSYVYDAADNPTTLGAITQSFDARSRITAATSAAGTAAFGYDAIGDRTSVAAPGRSPVMLRYDQAGHLTAYGAVTYAYDGDGLRASTTSGTTTTRYAWDRSAELPMLLTAGATAFVYGPSGQPVESITGTTATYLLADQSRSTRLLTDAAGAVIGTYAYDPYGKVTAQTGARTPMQYGGEYTDAESGYQYLRARYYDPATAQFLTVDPLIARTEAPYTYAGNDPLNRADSTGLDADSNRASAYARKSVSARLYVRSPTYRVPHLQNFEEPMLPGTPGGDIANGADEIARGAEFFVAGAQLEQYGKILSNAAAQLPKGQTCLGWVLVDDYGWTREWIPGDDRPSVLMAPGWSLSPAPVTGTSYIGDFGPPRGARPM